MNMTVLALAGTAVVSGQTKDLYEWRGNETGDYNCWLQGFQ